MSYKYSFADNKAYGAEDLNAITKRLVTSGVEDSFTDGVAYNVSKFNEAGKLLYTSGVVPESNLTLKVIAAEDGKILINPGRAFFDDGAVIEIEEGGETLSYVSGSKNYVYLKNDLINTNRCYPCCTVSEPDGYYVLLAEIDAAGTITDKRTYARGKLPGYQSVAGNAMRLQESIGVTNTGSGYYSGSRTFDIGDNTFEYILTYVKRANGGVSTQTLPCLGIYDIKESSYLSFYCNNINNSSGELYNASVCVHSLYICDYPNSNYSTAYITFSMDNGKLTVELNAYSKYDTPVGFDIDLILF